MSLVVVWYIFFCSTGVFYVFFFFQAEDGIRDDLVTGVQTCALPISGRSETGAFRSGTGAGRRLRPGRATEARPRAGRLVALGDGRLQGCGNAPVRSTARERAASERHDQIGRASCRERV